MSWTFKDLKSVILLFILGTIFSTASSKSTLFAIQYHLGNICEFVSLKLQLKTMLQYVEKSIST